VGCVLACSLCFMRARGILHMIVLACCIMVVSLVDSSVLLSLLSFLLEFLQNFPLLFLFLICSSSLWYCHCSSASQILEGRQSMGIN
jgi:ABC-type amino acid transport system permease subunit